MGFLFGLMFFADWQTGKQYRTEAIEKGYAEFDNVTGIWQWK